MSAPSGEAEKRVTADTVKEFAPAAVGMMVFVFLSGATNPTGPDPAECSAAAEVPVWRWSSLG